MASPFQDLKLILQDELRLYKALLVIANRKKKLLLEKFSVEFKKIAAEEEALAERLFELEERRKDCLSLALGVDDNLTLDDAIEAVSDSNLKSDLWVIGAELKDTVNEVKAVNAENKRLLEQALEITQYTINLITRAPSDGTYGPGGKERQQRPVSAGIFDRKA